VESIDALRQGRAARWLDGEDAHLLPRRLVGEEREGEPREIRSAAVAADDHVGILARELHLLLRLLPDDRLVQEHVVQDAPESVFRVVVGRGVLDRLGDGDAQASRAAWILLEDLPARSRPVRGRWD